MITVLSGTALLMSSCLKDKSHYVDFSKGGTFVDFPLGGYLNFTSEAITEAPADSVDGQPNDKQAVTRTFAVNVASANLPTSPTTVTLAVGTQADVDKVNSLQSAVKYEMIPSDAYSFTQKKVTIPAGQQYANTTVTFYKAMLDPTKSYLLPIYIADGGGQKLSSNLNIMYFHIIGNDFAGSYEWYYTRHETPDSTSAPSSNRLDEGPVTVFPVTHTEFTVTSWYYAQARYDVSYTETGTYPNATYSNIAIKFYGSDEQDDFDAYGLSVTQEPVFTSYPLGPDGKPAESLTYAQFEKYLFRYYYTTATRGIIDEYVRK